MLVCGVIAWVIYSVDMPQPFKTGAIGILIIIVLIAVFKIVLGYDAGIPFK
jgi:hypothetical protein